jgi:hypothetical protein
VWGRFLGGFWKKRAVKTAKYMHDLSAKTGSSCAELNYPPRPTALCRRAFAFNWGISTGDHSADTADAFAQRFASHHTSRKPANQSRYE